MRRRREIAVEALDAWSGGKAPLVDAIERAMEDYARERGKFLEGLLKGYAERVRDQQRQLREWQEGVRDGG